MHEPVKPKAANSEISAQAAPVRFLFKHDRIFTLSAQMISGGNPRYP